MKKLLLLILPLLLFACQRSQRGSGRITTENRNLAAFTSVDVAGSIDIELIQGDKNEVVVEGDDNILKYVETISSDGVLSVRLKQNTNLRNFTLRLRLTSPIYKEITAAASSQIISKNTLTSSDKITVKASSSSDITLQLDAPTVFADASSSAEITLLGKTKQLDANASSSSNLKLENLKAETVTANAGSSSSIDVFASVKLDANANSSAEINYTGGTKNVQKKESSSGSVSAR